jgi:hypothetical protein
MEFNQFLFPAPAPSYSSQTSLGEIIYIPKYDRDADGNIIQFKPNSFEEPDTPQDMLRNSMSFVNNKQGLLSGCMPSVANEEPAQKLQAVKQMRKQKLKQKTGEFIPCLYMPYINGSSKLLIYFHGNAEDVGLATDLLSFVMEKMKVSCITEKSEFV